MKFKSGQNVVCVDNLDMERTLIVGKTYVVNDQINDRILFIQGNSHQMYTDRFVEEGHKNLEKIVLVYSNIKKLDTKIQESYNLESDRGDDYFWQRESLRGNIEELEQIAKSLREE